MSYRAAQAVPYKQQSKAIRYPLFRAYLVSFCARIFEQTFRKARRPIEEYLRISIEDNVAWWKIRQKDECKKIPDRLLKSSIKIDMPQYTYIANVKNTQGGHVMEAYNLYKDIKDRTQGDIYIGVVGPVRTGKSTFIQKFMDLLVIPNIDNPHKKERTRDELPQSAHGRTIMTTEPKFIPNEAVEITLSDNAVMNVRMIDCVGYMVEGALGAFEDGTPRMVKTPWSTEPLPFVRAAEIGTKKVITEHSTIGLVITTDGSITDITRGEYTSAEERVISELKEINKPFIVILNSANPMGDSCEKLRTELEEKYSVPVLAVDCARMSSGDINKIIEKVLFEFPLSEITINLPTWVEALEPTHYVRNTIMETLREALKDVEKIRHTKVMAALMAQCEYVKEMRIDNISLGLGSINYTLYASQELYYKILGESTGLDIADEGQLLTLMLEMADIKKKYDKVKYAIEQVKETGYGIVSPGIDELSLEEPEIVKHGGRFGVKLKASAPSIHMIRADIETEVSPIVGTEKQSEELVKYLMAEFELDTQKIWQSNIFGKSLHELVNEGLHNKISRMPYDAQSKLRETLQKIINEGSGGLICIIL